MASFPENRSPYLHILFKMVVQLKAKVIVELGAGAGHSTIPLLMATIKNKGHLFSVDIERLQREADNRIKEAKLDTRYWTFLRTDDLDIKRVLWHVKKSIDLLFIDTSHYYEHTLNELKLYSKAISDKGVILLHDTLWVPFRRGGTCREGWDVKGAVDKWLETNPKWKFKELLPEDPGNSGLGLLTRRNA